MSKKFMDFSAEVHEHAEGKVCLKWYKIPKKLFLDFSKVEFYSTFLVLNDDPKEEQPS
jgi:hypothetical protein